VCRVEPLGLETHELGLVFAERYGLAIYDAMILASAQLADCRKVFTEDLQHGQVIEGRLKIINPFSKR
jgi:predicted nucleic acid-binding protein